MKDIEEYYKAYYTERKDTAYCMGAVARDSSRVSLLKHFIEERTPKGGTVLDVGCGDGYLATLMPQFNWVGIDFNLDKCPEGYNGKVQDLMVTPYPFADKSIDTVVCSEVLEHLWDIQVVHKEIHRILKDTGHYLISTPNFDWIEHQQNNFKQLLFNPAWNHLYEHIRQYNYESHEFFLNNAGFKVMTYCGADAHFGTFFQTARSYLKQTMIQLGHTTIKDADVDVVLGLCFPKINHTIMVLSRKAL